MSFADLAAQLQAARTSARSLDGASDNLVRTLDDAYRVQDELIGLAQGDVRGWKVTALSPVDQKIYASYRPVAGPLLGPYVQQTPANVSLSSLMAPLLECEIAFVLGSDLPARDAPYTQADIEQAVAAVVPAFELADSRVPASASGLMKLADAMGNGLFVVGPRCDDWRAIDLTDLPIALHLDRRAIDRGNSARILGNPLLAVIALANAQPLPGPGLKAGHIVTTGTCTTPLAITTGTYAADFGPLGMVELSVRA